ncbi:MAG: hypothetical protein GWM98_04300 [Nitrospinaceae bacterium]|nr:hypothetical protein [Nitrospinaceae bacterium]NIR53865.1 hypothetical protein [Nitrospinaceae bacterium]NIS84279.1 hypothetical protein [Nitrospinaceae bacterium]NIT81086.1 hypothetical protein [Nitrospinaceae bacterium]NIU43368.1 hypothetical protein [Nitrospinaceae bacterium]
MKSSVFTDRHDCLPLVTETGRAWQGLQRSSSPEMSLRVKELFEHLNGLFGFKPTPEGPIHQECFNCILRYAYPELMIDLADRVFVQHERPMVFLNLDHIHRNRNVDPKPPAVVTDLPDLDGRMESLFRDLAETLSGRPEWREEEPVVRLLAESYSYYMALTKNFPWEDPLKDTIPPGNSRVLDVATGLAGYSLIHDWPPSHPPLVLADHMPFIVEGLTHFKNLLGRPNVEILPTTFPDAGPTSKKFGTIHVSKFLHHLQRDERRRFLGWAWEQLEPGGRLSIIDTDLENNILKEAEDREYRSKLMPGYLETLVKIEDRFCHNLVDDIRELGYTVQEFDFHEYHDQTDAYSHFPGDDLPIRFLGFEIVAQKEY